MLTPLLPDWVAAIAFAASLFLFGMPHGAADLVPLRRWATRYPRPLARIATVLAVYTLAIALVIALLWAAPAQTLFLFLLISVLHFGVASTRLFAPLTVRQGVAIAGVVVLLPFAVQPAATTRVFDDASRLIGGGAFPEVFAVACAVAGFACFFYGLMLLFDRPRWCAFLVASLVMHLVLPPLLSVGLLFLAFHAVPETLRVSRYTDPVRAIIDAHLRSLWLLVPTLACVWLLGVARVETASVYTVALLTIVSYAAVTPPHFVFQEWITMRLERPARASATSPPLPLRGDTHRLAPRPPHAEQRVPGGRVCLTPMRPLRARTHPLVSRRA